MLRVAVPNKGQLAEPARSMLTEAGLPALGQHARPGRPRSRERRRVLLPAASGHRHLRGRGHPRRRHHRPRHAPRLRRQRRRDPAAGVRAVDLPAGRAHRHGHGRRPTCPGRTIATSYAGLLEAYLEREGISARVVKLDGAVENAVALGVADAVADVVATGTTLRKAGLELVGEPILVSEALVIRRREAPAGAGDRDLRPPAARRDGRALLRPRRLRHPHREDRAGVRDDPGHRVADGVVAARPARGRPCGPWCRRRTSTGSWTSCTSWVPAASSSPTSTPAGCSA